MTTFRDAARTKNARRDSRSRELGINVDDVRKESRSEHAVAGMTGRLMNDSATTSGHERIGESDFATGVFDGTNKEFQLPHRVLGQNIRMWRVDQASGSLIRLEKTTNPAPAGNQFWFDDQFTVRVGTAPQPFDALLAAFIRAL